jgi:Mg/Co/Ni transporter MgtE
VAATNLVARSESKTSVSAGELCKEVYEDEDVEHVAGNMNQLLVRRLPVVNRKKRLVGIVSIEDIAPRRH